MAGMKQTPGRARLSHLIERLKTDARLARDAAEAEGLLDVRALIDGVARSLQAAAGKVEAHTKGARAESLR
jgi:hypothetical protein